MTFLESNLAITALLWSVMILLLGASVASFLMVVSYRGQKGISWRRGRSFCDQCGRQLTWWQNIPVLSYLGLRGKCYFCHQRIPARYFWWELLLGSWTLIWFWACLAPSVWMGDTWVIIRAGLLWLLGAVLIWVALEDIRTQEIANKWLVWLAVLTGGWICFDVTNLIWRATMSVSVGGSFWLLNQISLKVWKKPGLGSGDAWVAVILCWWLSPRQALIWLLSSFWLGAAVGIVLICLRNKKRMQTLPFLPFLVGGFAISWFWGEMVFGWLF